MFAALQTTLGCNLRCTYCYAGSKVNKEMAPETLERSVDFLLEQAHDFLTLTFFGGEPMMRFDVLQTAVERLAKADSPERPIRFRMVTNGLMLNDDALAWLSDHNVIFTLSFDGVRAAQDRHRRSLGDHGSFDMLMRRVPAILRTNPYVKVNMVVNPDTAEFVSEGVRFLHEFGFRYLDLSPDYAGAWDRRTLRILEKQYREVAEYYVDCHRKRSKIHINFIDDKIRAFALADVDRERSSCQAGLKQVAIAPSGRVYPCVQFVRDDEPQDQVNALGDVWNGINVDARRDFLTRSHRAAPECGSCAFLGRCHNWCACTNWNGTGHPGLPPAFLCEYERMVIPIADRVGERLWKERNRLFIDKTYNEAWPILSYLEEMRK